MSYGQSNIILLIINIFTYISVILESICDILDLNLGKIQLQMSDIYVRRICPLNAHTQTPLILLINTKTPALSTGKTANTTCDDVRPNYLLCDLTKSRVSPNSNRDDLVALSAVSDK